MMCLDQLVLLEFFSKDILYCVIYVCDTADWLLLGRVKFGILTSNRYLASGKQLL